MRHIKPKIKKLLSILIYQQIPAPMGMKFFSLVLTGIIVLITGTILLFVTGIGKTEAVAFFFPVIVGAGLILYGGIFKLSLVKNGWITLEGTCINHLYNFNFIPSQVINVERRMRGHAQGPDAFIVNTTQEMLYVPAAKKSALPQIGCRVRLYISENAQKYAGSSGYIHADPIYGYEVLPEPQGENTDKNN